MSVSYLLSKLKSDSARWLDLAVFGHTCSDLIKAQCKQLTINLIWLKIPIIINSRQVPMNPIKFYLVYSSSGDVRCVVGVWLLHSLLSTYLMATSGYLDTKTPKLLEVK